jgi:hypothetical protein
MTPAGRPVSRRNAAGLARLQQAAAAIDELTRNAGRTRTDFRRVAPSARTFPQRLGAWGSPRRWKERDHSLKGVRRALPPKTAMSKKSLPPARPFQEWLSMVPADLVQSRKVPPGPSVQFREAELKEGAASVRGFTQTSATMGEDGTPAPVPLRTGIPGK